MKASRRNALALALAAGAAGLAPPPAAAQQVNRLGRWRRGIDGQRRADLGDGHYLNPILAGDHPTPTVLKDGANYYATFASADYYPGLILWRSPDLVNWTPIGAAITTPIGAIHAPELVRHGGRYFLYFATLPFGEPHASTAEPAWHDKFTLYVVHAETIHGPWSEPRALGVTGRCDPGHIVAPDGTRYLFLDGGHRVALARDGLRTVSRPVKVYDGWPIPKDFLNQGFSFAGPKLIRRNGWVYMFSAQGGSSGPANGHMVVVARARSIDGPWENSPRNPLVRADARDDPWWSRGHATPVEGTDGRWWLVYSADEKALRSLGRQAILEPFAWDADGWPRATGGILADPMPKPAEIAGATHGRALGGAFATSDLGPRLAFYRPSADYRTRATFEDGAMFLSARGSTPADSSPLAMIAGDIRYDLAIDIEVSPGAEAGLLLFYNDRLFCGLSTDGAKLCRYNLGREMRYPALDLTAGQRVRIRLVYKEDVASFYIGGAGAEWTRVTTFEVSGYNHNMAGEFLSLRPALFACGRGQAIFRDLRYDGAI